MPDPTTRPTMDADIVCVGFGPAAGGFLTTLAAALLNPDGSPALESPSMPGMPLQVMCYERADDVGFGVSGVVTQATSLRESFPELDPAPIPMTAAVTKEMFLYLLDRAATRCHRIAVDPVVSEQTRRTHPLDGPVHPVGRQPGHGHRRGANLARQPRRRGHH